jgi:2-(1,2-epoxy-1,2-dihydrophenyl)acetyl-CoA isomerase
MIRLDDGPHGTLVVSLDRPRQANALTLALVRELGDVLRVAFDARPAGVVLTGSGRAFCAGADLAEAPAEVSMGDNLRRFYGPVVMLLHDAPVPVVAALNGMAAGGGLGLALACHRRDASTSAAMRAAFIDVGLAPDCGVSYFLVRLLGVAGAYRFCTGGALGAADAHRIGLVDEIADPDELLDVAASAAVEMAANTTDAHRETLRLLYAASSADLAATMELEARAQERLGRAELFRAARDAFFDRRRPASPEPSD